MDAMRCGDFAAAWAVSDQVLAGRDPAGRDDPSLPYHLRWVWDGRAFDGRSVLVRCYHGLGDTLMFCRYLAPLRRRVRSLALEVQPELLGLLAGLPGPDRLIPFDPASPAPPSECDIEIMELAHALRLPPDPTPYVSADPVHGGRDALMAGLCWQTGGWGHGRSIPLPLLAPLAAVAGLCLVCLQRGPAQSDVQLPGAPPMEGGADASMDVLHTARLIRGLDLVVTPDTMVAHLAGALGVPVRLLLMAEPDWRWCAGGRGSPWYRNLRKYCQHAAGDWHAPVAELTADLTEMARDRSVRETRCGSSCL